MPYRHDGRLYSDDGVLQTLIRPIGGIPQTYVRSGGWAVDDNGFSFVEHTSKVPQTAVRHEGQAFTSDGALYVTSANFATSDYRHNGLRYREDGALYIQPDGVLSAGELMNGGWRRTTSGRAFIAGPSFVLDFADMGSGQVNVATSSGLGAPTFTRNTPATTISSTGTILDVLTDIPRSYHSADGLFTPLGYLAEGARTNLVVRGEDFGNMWSAIATPTLAADGVTCGVLTLDTIGDNDGAGLEGYAQPIAFTVSGTVKALSLFVSKGTSTSSVFRLRDTTAGADRMLMVLTWTGGNAPIVSATTGTHLLTETLAGGVYRLHFQTTAVLSANTNRIEIYPATDAALATTATGTLHVGGVQAEEATFASSLIRTPASATVTRNADVLTYPTTGWFNAATGTMFAQFRADPVSAGRGAFIISDTTSNEIYTLQTTSGNANLFEVVDGGAAQATLTNGSVTAGVNLKYAGSYAANDIAFSFNAAAPAVDATATLPTVTTAYIGNSNGGGQLFGPIRRVAYWPVRLSNSQLQQITS